MVSSHELLHLIRSKYDFSLFLLDSGNVFYWLIIVSCAKIMLLGFVKNTKETRDQNEDTMKQL